MSKVAVLVVLCAYPEEHKTAYPRHYLAHLPKCKRASCDSPALPNGQLCEVHKGTRP